ncbi:hypothetical protein WH50_00510 [Pokkaliibacter plantistimulans]|uniref:Phasin domain-containing protein n=2 Tax=Pseudomonadota TaxID=1224 RepID=A0ABX5M6C6_9GAMM|nr:MULTISPECIES: phasin family protein [Pokkaliibacter]MDH2435211.1 phasin family protein [Pokkaliibacter sp. MBI-7]PPC79380.1 hypothetical protein C4K68_00240 [Pokkaliibacter plantistimulans]PXF33231.1 hypothetical protein WH50_00510 [Pokkaliibacter plantistimulans]
MYEAYFTDFKKTFAPMTEAMEISKKAFDKLSSCQSACFVDLSGKCFKQSQALMETKDVKAAMDLQVQFAKDMEARLTNTFEESVAAMTEARESYTALFEKQMSELTDSSTAFDFSKFVDFSKFALDKAKETTKEVTKTASKTASKAAATATE